MTFIIIPLSFYNLLKKSPHVALSVHISNCVWLPVGWITFFCRNCHGKCPRAWLPFRINFSIREDNLGTASACHVLSARLQSPEGMQATPKNPPCCWHSCIHPPFIHYTITDVSLKAVWKPHLKSAKPERLPLVVSDIRGLFWAVKMETFHVYWKPWRRHWHHQWGSRSVFLSKWEMLSEWNK